MPRFSHVYVLGRAFMHRYRRGYFIACIALFVTKWAIMWGTLIDGTSSCPYVCGAGFVCPRFLLVQISDTCIHHSAEFACCRNHPEMLNVIMIYSLKTGHTPQDGAVHAILFLLAVTILTLDRARLARTPVELG
jgi:hypothetical protein